MLLISCTGKQKNIESESTANEALYQNSSDEEQTETGMEIPFTTISGGNITIPVKINGMTLEMIYDTGASTTMITKSEANYMYEKGNFLKSDVLNLEFFETASGDISAGYKINLREVELGDVKLNNIEALVVENQQAPLLLGQSVMRQFGKITVDYDKKVIRFPEQ